MLEQSIETLTAEIRKLTVAVTERNRLLGLATHADARVFGSGSPSLVGDSIAPLYLAQSEQPRFLNDRQVAATLGMSIGAVRKWRVSGHGPRFVRLGRAVRYDRRELLEWAARQRWSE